VPVHGLVPPLADCFNSRPETGPAALDAQPAGQLLVLAAPPGPAVDWPGGTGKTQLAVHLAQTWCHRHADALLIWVSASSRAAVLSSYVQAFAERTGMAPAGDGETIAARFLAWLAETGRPWLVVLDDVSDPAHLDGLWPAGPAGRVLVTTAAEGTVPAARNPALFPVGAFSSHEALTYLMGRLSADPDQRLGAVDLVQDLGGDPLALFQASAAIASSGLSCRDYRDLFAAQQEQLAKVSGAQPGAKVVTWMLSVERADQLVPGGAAQSCLALAVLLGGHGIPETVFAAPAAGEFIAGSTGLAPGDHRGPHGALRSLQRTGLLTIDPVAGGARVIRVHPVVQTVVRTAMPGEVRDQAAQAAAGALLQAWPEDDDEQPLLAGALRSCVASLEQAAGDALWAGGSHQVLFRAGLSLDSARLSGPAVAHWQLVASASERTLGPGHPDTLLAAGQLASATLAAGLGAEAVPLYQRALDTRIKVLGPDHPGTLAARADLGGALLAAGQPFEAIVALEAVLAEAPSAEPADHGILDLSVLDIQDMLAAAYQAAGRNPDAIRLAARTLAEREEQQGPDHPDTMSTRGALARACLAAGRVKDAIRHCRQAHDSARRVLGPEDPGTLSALSALAGAYHSARRLKDAIPLYEQVLRDRERIQGPDHPDTLGGRGQLASAYHSAGRMASALELYERSRADCRRVLGPSHPDTLAAQANLAHAYYAVGRQADATRLLTGALADCERLLPAGDPLTGAIRDSLDAVSRG
jgi:tetratricopeptide (TPR) repeat protein